MLAVTQFEVHVYQKGRWSIHSRYHSHEREDAVRDAMATESVIGCPTKVIRETYFPENNTTETITAYMSTKAKKLREKTSLPRKTLPNAKNRALPQNAQATAAPLLRQRLSARNVFFRIVVAAAISVATTTLIVGVLAWMLSRFAEAGLSMSGTLTNSILTYGYIAIFLFSFGSLFRSRLPLHRVLAELWATAREEKPSESKRDRAAPLLKLKPKHDPASSPERLKEWNEMKLRRGDLDMADPAKTEDADVEAPADKPAAMEAADIAPKVDPQTTDQKVTSADRDTNADPALDETPSSENAELETHQKREENKQKPVEAQDAEEQISESDDDARDLERKILLRFTKDIITPVTEAMPDDPVTRRSGALVLAGAVTALTKTPPRDARANSALLRSMAHEIDTSPYLTSGFLDEYEEHIGSQDNASVVEAGREIMMRYLAGETQLANALATVLAEWRTPFSSPPGTLSSDATDTHATSVASLLGVYLLTEVRHSPQAKTDPIDETRIEAARDATMGAHNSIVRAAVHAHVGNEITHTGKGIFAQFESPDDALTAAADIQKQFKAVGGATIAIAIIGNSDPDADPNFSPTLSRHAQDVVAKAEGGEILCERSVQLETESPQSMQVLDLENNQSANSDISEPLIAIAAETIPTATLESPRVT